MEKKKKNELILPALLPRILKGKLNKCEFFIFKSFFKLSSSSVS